eukprot:TRINITY_DN39742_c0_g1_i1.p1 TRINITY_DN39742_c0_g1~~TRINITY_DN39742_c0_g1_i1.p1  ORF type:complete len:293 (+),score=45.79 TRINITY_DN39742_c0_g1_i1:482-1360(+)
MTSLRSASYDVQQLNFSPEDIVLCTDIDAEIDSDMKTGGSASRLDAVKQAWMLFVHAKLQMDSRHRFALMTLGTQPMWLLRGFTNDFNAIYPAIQSLRSGGVFSHCDLFALFRLVASEAQMSRAQGRSLRLVLLYSRSTVVPDWSVPPGATPLPRCFSADVMYLHDRQAETNRAQDIYDTLVTSLESISVNHSFAFESGSGIARLLFRNMVSLLAHPQQRTEQEGLDTPRDITPLVPPPGTLATYPPPAANALSGNASPGIGSNAPSTRKPSAVYHIADEDPNTSPYSLHSG